MTAFAGNEFLYRRGDTDPRFLAPASATVIEVGDLLFRDPVTNKPEPASSMSDQGSPTLNQDTFQQFFLGVALKASYDGDTGKIAIATKGTFEFDVASGTWEAGALFGAAENSAGDGIEDKKVATAASGTRAIGRAHEQISSAATKIYVDIVSTIFHGGIQAQPAGSSSGTV